MSQHTTTNIDRRRFNRSTLVSAGTAALLHALGSAFSGGVLAQGSGPATTGAAPGSSSSATAS